MSTVIRIISLFDALADLRKDDTFSVTFNLHALVCQKLDNALHQINLCPVDSVIGFCNTAKTRILEARIFEVRLNRFLYFRVVFTIQADQILNRFRGCRSITVGKNIVLLTKMLAYRIKKHIHNNSLSELSHTITIQNFHYEKVIFFLYINLFFFPRLKRFLYFFRYLIECQIQPVGS